MQDINSTRAAFIKLGSFLLSNDPKLKEVSNLAQIKNPWFTQENINLAISNIAKEYLEEEKLTEWLSKYEVVSKEESKIIALVPAGNIPLVGFHDILCILLSGHRLMIKFSDKDEVLSDFILSKLIEFDPTLNSKIDITTRLKGYDAVIATGSNNSARYFDYYFGKSPHIIRKNRNSLAILSGDETDTQLLRLSSDIFSFFGLGCRNVSKLYVPEGFDFYRMLELYQQFAPLSNHTKYRNNLDYNIALYLLNREHYLNNGCLIIKNDQRLASRIATLHYEEYKDLAELKKELSTQKETIQCVISDRFYSDFENGFKFGEAQRPSLTDYADGVDTMSFLSKL